MISLVDKREFGLFKISKKKVAVISIFVLMLSMVFGKPIIGDKLSFANIVQILFVLFSFLYSKFSKKEYIAILFFSISVIFSIINVLLVYNFEGNFPVCAFVIVSLLMSFSIIKISKNFFDFKFFDNFIRFFLWTMLIVHIALALIEEMSAPLWLSFGMDDKSHAAIILCFLAFLAIGTDRKPQYILGISFLVLSALTISRLPAIFALFFIIAIFIKIWKEKKFINAMKMSLSLLSVLTLVLYLVILNSDTFKVVDRLSSVDSVTESDSTTAHNELLVEAFKLKLDNFGNILLGVSPGGFSEVLVRSDIDYSIIEALDPQFIQYAREGRAPVHSTNLAVFCEYPIWIFAAYVYFIGWMCWSFYRLSMATELLFWISFLIATTYYSSHNKSYYFIIISILFLKMNYRKQLSKYNHSNFLSRNSASSHGI